MNTNSSNNFYNKIKNSFNKAAVTYDANAVLQHEIGRRLIERLELFTINPLTILDLGMGSGATTKLLAKQYPAATIIGLDFAEKMLATAKQDNYSANINLLCADINKLPIADHSIDLIFSNFSIQWCENVTLLFKECRRVLKNDGILFFSIPGPDTLYELRTALHKVDPNFNHINNFIDMHDLGDILVQSKFAHPVMDNDVFTLTYSNVLNILKDLKNIGANIKLTDNYRHSMFGKDRFKQLCAEYENFKYPDNNKLMLTYEVIYGHAFKMAKPVKVKHPEISEIAIPIEKIIKK
jgi:malonyl-CoA O-methyltransferase